MKDFAAWDEYVMNHPRGLAYHQVAWRIAVNNAYKFTGPYLLAFKGGRIHGVLPLIFFKRPFGGGEMISLPYCDAGGVLADDERVEKELIGHALDLTRAKKVRKLEVRFSHPINSHYASSNAKVRMLLDIPGNSQELFKNLKAKVRNQVRKGQREGLSTKLGGLELLDDFYSVFTENMRDLGSPVHSRRWIREIVSAYGERAKIGVVYTNEHIPAAAGVMLFHKRIVNVPWASSLRRLNKLNANMLLYWTFLAHSADSGYTRFDFGRSSPSEGTYQFKKQWGGTPEPLTWHHYSSFHGELPVASTTGHRVSPLMRSLAGSLWKMLPLPLANTLGPMVRRYVSL
jgi:FemAB-related protein (PEP-CTERM system-associated)